MKKNYQSKNLNYKQRQQKSNSDFEPVKIEPVQKNKSVFATNIRLQALILFLFAILLYTNSIFEFSLNDLQFHAHKYTLDDMLAITSNKYTKEGIKGIKDIMTHDAFDGFFGEKKNLLPGGRYRPLAQIMFAVEYEIFGLNPFVGHLINVLLYASMCVFLFYILRRLFKPYKSTQWYLSMPFLIAALFVAHPLHTEAVANIKGRDEIMSFFGSLATLWFTLKYIETRKNINLLWSLIFFLLAILSKENAITFFAVIPLTLFVFTESKFKDYLITITPLVVCIVVYFIIRKVALGFILSNNAEEKELLNNPFVNATTNEKYATIFYTWLIYIKLLIFPHPLTHDYYPKQIALISWDNIKAIGSLLVVFGLIAFAVKNIFKKNLIAFSILFFFITFSIQSNLVFNIGAFMNERFMFAPLLGFCIVIAWFINIYLSKIIKDKEKYRQTVVFILIILFVGYSLKTFTRNFTWKDDFTLFTTDVNTSTNSAKCNVSAGGMWIEEANRQKDSIKRTEMLVKATGYLKKGMEIHPGHVAGWILLGNAYMFLKDYPLSRYYYENCLKINHSHGDALTNLKALAQNCINAKDYADAVKSYKTYLTYKPNDIDVLVQLSDQYPYIGRADTSIIILNDVIAKDPKNYTAFNILGKIYGQYFNNLDKSIEYLDKSIEIKPDDPSTLENLGVANGIKKDYDKSISYFKKAIKFKPNNAQLYTNLGNSYMQKGDKVNANLCFAKAKEITEKDKKKQ